MASRRGEDEYRSPGERPGWTVLLCRQSVTERPVATMHTYFPDNEAFSFQITRLVGEAPAGGADWNEMHLALREMEAGDTDSWYEQWLGLADEVVALADEAAEAGHEVTARKARLRAANYYRAAEFYLGSDDERKVPTYDLAAETFRRAAKSMNNLHRVDIPFENSTLPAYLLTPHGDETDVPVVVYIGGADSIKEELYFLGAKQLAERGVATLFIEGPGQGEPLRYRDMYVRPDFEVATSSCIDFLEANERVDADRLGVMGVSLGGFYGPRSAAFDDRIEALVAYGACHDVARDCFDFFPPIREQLEWITGADSQQEARELLSEFTLDGVLDQVTCPTLVCHGENDGIVDPQSAIKTYEGLSNAPRELKMWAEEDGGSEHCMVDITVRAVPYMADWLANELS